MKVRFRQSFVPSLLGGIMLLIVGCGQSTQGGKPERKPAQVGETKGHEHEGWWCAEHGVPEEECSQCNAKVAVEFKSKGDWCEEHDRAKSQCFKCDPKLKEKYAALYRAKEGKGPPPTEDEKPDKKE
jgi:hypothetical protein